MRSISIRARLTLWYALLVAIIVGSLGLGVFYGTSWGLQETADRELSSGIDGVNTFLHRKLAQHEMGNLNEELREHSALLPRGKMFRVSNSAGFVVYQPDVMTSVSPVVPRGLEMRKQSISLGSHSFRSIGRYVAVGSYTFLIQVAVDQTEYEELMQHLSWLLMASLPVACILSAVAGFWMSGWALAPIEKITETTNTIDAASLKLRLPLFGTGDELDQLSTTINHMLDRIAISYDRISQFTADASHELRTPIARVHSTAELLIMGPSDQARIQEGLSAILSESDYMTHLVRDLLILARTGLEEGQAVTELFELGESVNAMLPRAVSLAATRGIAVELSGEDLLPVFGNQSVVERTLMILVDNAVRYTPAEGNIWISTWSRGEQCGFTVRDNGIGIAASDQVRVFERFYRVDTVRTPGDGGSGLGLSIAKSLVELHGGSIQVHSKVGKGSSFHVGFPRAKLSASLGEPRVMVASSRPLE